jgi:hypothetical protein
MLNQNVLSSSVRIADVTLPPGPQGRWYQITFGEQGTVSRGQFPDGSGDVHNVTQSTDAVLTLTYRSQDIGHQLLAGLHARIQAAQALGQRVPLPGVALKVSDPAAWNDAMLQTAGDVVEGTETEEVQWVFVLSGARRLR